MNPARRIAHGGPAQGLDRGPAYQRRTGSLQAGDQGPPRGYAPGQHAENRHGGGPRAGIGVNQDAVEYAEKRHGVYGGGQLCQLVQ